MRIVPIVVVGALLILAVALGLHCIVLHCDDDRESERRRRRDRHSRQDHDLD